MEKNENQNETSVGGGESLLQGAVLATTLSVILVVVLTVVGELYAPLKNHLKDTLYHHWVGKGVWSVVLFVVVTMAGNSIFKKRPVSTKNLMKCLNWALIIGSLILFFFFVYEYNVHH